jgi:hypothetical protein
MTIYLTLTDLHWNFIIVDLSDNSEFEILW